MNTKLVFVVLALLVLAMNLAAQTSLNPDISAIGDVRGFIHDDINRESEQQEFKLADPELELYISGYLNPYARADLNIAWHGDHNAEVEELYGTILRGLPLGMNLRAGKYLLEFGRLNPVHPHAYSFLHRPLPHESFFGEEGLNDVAVRSSFYIPTGEAYTELMFGVLQGDLLFAHHHEEEAHEHEEEGGEEEEADPGLGVFGRLTTSLAIGESGELALSGSVVNAVYAVEHAEFEGDPEEQLRAWLIGGDVKYKHKPSRYTSLQIEGEGIARVEELHDGDKLTSFGAYGYIDYRFRQKYNVGGILEWVREKEAHHEHDEEEELQKIAATFQEEELTSAATWRAGLFLGFAPVEETSLVRLVGNWTKPEDADGFWELTLQFLFILGPHKPHNF